MKVGDKVYLLEAKMKWEGGGVKMLSSTITKITPKMMLLEPDLNYRSRFYKDDFTISFSFNEAREKFIARRSNAIISAQNQIAILEYEIEQAKALKDD